ncbi:MAG: tetratricopeptide repeat protein [Oligoflexia bacterium]|nr:tetratricopeptide repeat protein [Oligoflexia bacterium]
MTIFVSHLSANFALSDPHATTSVDTALIEQRESLAREAVQRDPHSENARVRLASVLIDQGKLDEASKELDLVLKDNPNNISAKILRDSLAIHSSSKPDQAKAAELLAKLAANLKSLDKQVPSFDASRIRRDSDERKRLIDEKYHISTFQFPKDPRPVLSERRKLILDLRLSGEKSRLAEALKAEFDEFPNSIDARLEYADFLIANDHADEAANLINAGLSSNPEHPFLLIMRDGLSDIEIAASSEQKLSQRQKLIFDMLSARSIRSDALMQRINHPAN